MTAPKTDFSRHKTTRFLSKYTVSACAYLLLYSLISPLLGAGASSKSDVSEPFPDNSPLKLDALEVSGERIDRTAYKGNKDLVRTEYDVQPYTILGRDVIMRSGATTVEDLLRQELTMSTTYYSGAQNAAGYAGSASSVSLRGLTASETLVLVNGRRLVGVGLDDSTEASDQIDLNGIPLSAIDRIEVLPASASAIYGASAVGGVINVVLRRDYTGHEVNTRFEITDDGHASIETFNWTSNFQFEGGRTKLMISAQYQDRRALYGHQRDFQRKGREKVLNNDPESLYSPANTAGSPPWGALVNIRSRNGTPLFGPGSSYFTHIPKGYRGWKIDGLQPLIDNQGTYNLDLARGLASGFTADSELIAGSRSKSFSLSASREMTDKLRVFLDGGYSHSEQNPHDNYYGAWTVRLPASSPNNPFGQDVQITYPVSNADRNASSEVNSTVRTERAALGIEYELPHSWRLFADYSWSHTVNHFQFQGPYGSPSRTQAIANGDLDVLRDTTSFPTLIDNYSGIYHRISNGWSSDATLRAAGELGRWWYADPITLVGGIERRELRNAAIAGNDSDLHPPPIYRRQQITSFYSEVSVPLVAAQQRRRGWLHNAELQVAARRERFDVESAGSKYSTTVPTFGLRYMPVRELILRGSYGRGFRAPLYSQLATPTLSSSPSTLTDPLRGGETISVYTMTGGNPDITPETSRNLNLGLVWSPEAIPGLRLSADWYKIEKRNNITTLGAQQILDEEQLFPGRVTREAPAPGDPYGVGPVALINRSYINLLKMETSGLDLGLRYLWQGGGFGDINASLNATLTNTYRTQTSFTSGIVDRKGVPSAPIARRINGSLGWNRDAWHIGWASQYHSSYRITPTSLSLLRRQGGPTVASQIYHDLFVRYRVPTRGKRWMEGLELTLGVKNVFDKAPPTDMRLIYSYSPFGDPRMRRIYANVKKTF